jgi:hypothetical protein
METDEAAGLNLPPHAFKDTAMFLPFHHRIRLRVGMTVLAVLLIVGLVATLGLVHTP